MIMLVLELEKLKQRSSAKYECKRNSQKMLFNRNVGCYTTSTTPNCTKHTTTPKIENRSRFDQNLS